MSAPRDELIAAGAERIRDAIQKVQGGYEGPRPADAELDAFLAHPSALVGVMVEAGILEQVGWHNADWQETAPLHGITHDKLREATDEERAKTPWRPVYRVVGDTP